MSWRSRSLAVLLTIVCLSAGRADEAADFEEIAKWQTPTPPPRIPEQPEDPRAMREYFEKTRPLWEEYWSKEHPRLLNLAKASRQFLASHPQSEKAAGIQKEMARALTSVIGAKDLLGAEAAQLSAELLEKQDLDAATAVIFYSHQMNMIFIMGWKADIPGLTPVPEDAEGALPAMQELVGQFAKRYPASLELARLYYMGSVPLRHRNQTALADAWLGQAEKFGDAEMKARVAGQRFRTNAVGSPTPPLKFTALDGRKIDTAKWKGKVILLDFWATWCGPCIRELPEVQKAYEQYHDAGLEVLGISLDQDKGKLESFVQVRQLPWPQYFDGLGWENVLARQFCVEGIPDVWIIDRKGIIAAVSPADLMASLQKILAEKSAAE